MSKPKLTQAEWEALIKHLKEKIEESKKKRPKVVSGIYDRL